MKAVSSICDLAESFVSVIIPAYNSMPYLADCIKSLTDQSYANLQIIVIDDGSSDNTAQFMQSLNDARIDFVRTDNRGVSAARNLGLSKVTGKFVMFVDADDVIEPSAIRQAVGFLVENELDMAVGGLTKDYGNHEAFLGSATEMQDTAIFEGPEVQKVIEKAIAYDVPGERYLSSFFMSGSVCKLIKADLLQGLEFDPSLAVGEDTHFNVKVLKRCNRVGFVSENWYRYFIRETSAVRRYRPDAFSNAELLLRRLREELCTGDEEGSWPPCIVGRGIRQFLVACKASVVHREAGNGFWASVRKVKRLLCSGFWSDLFGHGERWLSYICGSRYRLFGKICWKKQAALLCLYLKAAQLKADVSARREK